VSYGFTFGASATNFFGKVSNIRWPSDVNGVYVVAGTGAAVGPGGGAILMTNQNGAYVCQIRQTARRPIRRDGAWSAQETIFLAAGRLPSCKAAYVPGARSQV
jgi:hypothetical protein